ncbi:MAG: hypothetical protein ACFB5Z_11540 [Elainellaceae cyanobacterium]
MTTGRDTSIRTPLFMKGWQAIAYSRLWTMLLLAAGVASSLISAHAPLAAFAAASGLTLPRPRAIKMVTTIWAVNQGLGFTLWRYPLETTAFAWGAIMGVGALLAVNLASRSPEALRRSWGGYWAWGAIALVGSVALYQGLIGLMFPVLAGGPALGWGMVGKLVAKQAAWAIAIAACHALWLKSAIYFSQRSR